MFEYNLYPIYFLLLLTNFIYIKSFFINVSFDIVDDEGSFEFSTKAELTLPFTFTSPLQKTLKEDHSTFHNSYSVKNMLKLLTFKWLLNQILLEEKCKSGDLSH